MKKGERRKRKCVKRVKRSEEGEREERERERERGEREREGE